jgi:hypothetical protein
MHTFVDGSFMVALTQPVSNVQESDGEVSVCVTAVSSTAMLSGNVAALVRTESGTATETGVYFVLLAFNYPQAHSQLTRMQHLKS